MQTHDDRWWNHIDFAFDPNIPKASRGEILVGLGNSQDPDQAGVVLNSKYRDSPFRSVSRYVLAANDATLARWRSCLPGGLADVRRVVMEDLSLDSCFSLMLFFEMLSGRTANPTAEHVEQWCRYVTRWEEGYTRQERSWDESIAYLVTTLGHTYFDVEEERKRSEVIDPAEFNEGARACLELVSAAFAQGRSPESLDLGSLEQSRAFLRARSHMEYERAQYQLALQHGRRCQLSVPLSGSKRTMIVDALFLEERDPSGLLKVFARSDRENTWTRRGFDLLGLYRPREAGNGGDMTISVAPESGLTLRDLWEELERQEWQRWGPARPCDDPRRIESYKNSDRAPNQPWWDDYGKCTLLGAPKRVSVDGRLEFGTKLDWYDDVLAAVWKCYSPVPEAYIQSEQRLDSGGKKLWHCRWKEVVEESGEPAIAPTTSAANCPTFRAWLKTLSSEDKPIASPMNLPSESSFRVLSLDGGFLVVHRGGATAFDDWTATHLEIATIDSIFSDMARAWDGLKAFHENKSLEHALEYQSELLGHRTKFHHKAFEKWKAQSWANRAEVLKVGVSVLNHADPWPLNEFRSLLATVWGFDEQRHEVLEAVDRIDHITSEIATHLREHRTKFLQAAGAGLALGILAKEVAETILDARVANTYKWQLELFRAFVPPDAVEPLNHIAEHLHSWHLGVMVALIAGLAGGVGLYLRYGAKMSEH